MFRYVLAAALAAFSMSAQAQSGAVASQVEASMLVTGSLDIATDGSVISHVIDERERVPEYAVDLVDRAAKAWRFAPYLVDGQPVVARARMTLRLLAKPLEAGDVEVSISSATFGDRYPKGSDYVSSIRMLPPSYPRKALMQGGSGTAYLVLKIDRSGRVADAIVEQVNLGGITNERTMKDFRKQFSRAALASARRWTFAPPTTGEDADDPFWSMRVPVEFTLDNTSEKANYGKWVAYVPGPRQTAPWLDKDGTPGNDALSAGAFHQAGTGFRLLTPLLPET